MTVSPRKRSLVVGRMRPSTKSGKDSPPQEDWSAAENFQFTESPAFSRRNVGRRSAKTKGVSNLKDISQQKRRQSVLLKRLDLPADLVSTSPNVRRTRRQSMGNLRRARDTLQEPARASKLPRAVSEKTVKSKNVKLPPAKPETTKKESTKSARVETETVISPQKFYSSPEKTSKIMRRSSFVASSLEENLVSEKDNKRKSESSKLSIKKIQDPPNKLKKVTEMKKAVDSDSTPVTLRSQKSASGKLKKASEETSSPARKLIKETSSTPAPDKVGIAKSPVSSLRKTKKSSTQSPTPAILKRLGNKTPNQSPKIRITRSAARSSQRVRIVAASPSPSSSAFRKTPKSSKKEITILTDELGSSPALSAQLQLQLIRCSSPLKTKRKGASAKAKPFTPKPDPPPRNMLKQTMKKKVDKKMKSTTKVEVHKLMDEEISTVKTKATEAQTCQIPTTPRSNIILPPTPKSSRKSFSSIVSRRSALRSSDLLPSSPTSPRSSTPIEEDNTLDDLSVDPVTSTFNQEEEEVPITELNEDTPSKPDAEQAKRSYCTVM